jgi:hypothetical protein
MISKRTCSMIRLSPIEIALARIPKTETGLVVGPAFILCPTYASQQHT